MYTCVLLKYGKVGTRYNVIKIPKEEKGRVIRKTVIDNGTVGRRLTDEEFVNMYPSQCNIFKVNNNNFNLKINFINLSKI